jgi:integrase
MPRPKNLMPIPVLKTDHTGIYVASYTGPEGYTKRVSLGTRDKVEAAKKFRAVEVDIIAKSSGPKSATYTMKEVLTAFLHREGEKSDKHKYDVPRLIEYFDAFKPEQLGDAAWSGYRKHRTHQPKRNAPAKFSEPTNVIDSTAVRELHTMRAAINWAKRSGRWKGLEHVEVTLPGIVAGKVEEFWTVEQLDLALAACTGDHQQLFILLGVASGARMTALLELKWSNVKMPADVTLPTTTETCHETGEVFEVPDIAAVASTEGDLASLTINTDVVKVPGIVIDFGPGNGNKRRPTTHVNETNLVLWQLLKRAHANKQTDYVIEYKGKSIETIDLKPVYERAGLPRPKQPQHILKHTCISLLVQAGVPIPIIAKHTQTSAKMIEERYGHLRNDQLAAAGKALVIRRIGLPSRGY